MNWRRGLFRLWIVGAALFVIAVAAVSYSDIKADFDKVALQKYMEERSAVLVPQLCGDARGVAGSDYSRLEVTSKPNFFDNCWYEIPKFRALYPEFKNISDKELTQKLYKDLGIPTRELPNPWATLGVWASVAFGVPLVVLVLGASLTWAFSGFAATRS
jgi:hypothetical protein